jgi:hypothetical protein
LSGSRTVEEGTYAVKWTWNRMQFIEIWLHLLPANHHRLFCYGGSMDRVLSLLYIFPIFSDILNLHMYFGWFIIIVKGLYQKEYLQFCLNGRFGRENIICCVVKRRCRGANPVRGWLPKSRPFLPFAQTRGSALQKRLLYVWVSSPACASLLAIDNMETVSIHHVHSIPFCLSIVVSFSHTATLWSSISMKF